MIIKAITLWQPWASFMALGLKPDETRSWATDYRGPLAIAAAFKEPKSEIPLDLLRLGIDKLGNYQGWPRGKVLCVVDLIEIYTSTGVISNPENIKYALGNYAKGRKIWRTTMLQVFDEPIPCKGHQSLWDWEWRRL